MVRSLVLLLVSAAVGTSSHFGSSILARGQFTVVPKAVDPRTAQGLLEDMYLGRMFEDKVAELYFKGKVSGFVHLYNGQEAVATGVIKALRQDDYVVSTYRDHVHAISKGVPPREVMAELQGKGSGCSKGRGGSMHMFSKEHNFVGGFAFIGEQVPIALGIAFSIAYRRSLFGRTAPLGTHNPHDQIVVCFTGDGSTNIGQFYESMNIAALSKLPVIFVVENNNWAIGMAHYRSTSVPEIAAKGPPFGIPSFEVDGMNVLAVRAAARDAIDRARAGLGPSLIEAMTYRFRGHSVADPDEMRAQVEKQTLLTRCPIKIFIDEYLKPNGMTSDAVLEETRAKIKSIVNDASEFAIQSALPCPKTLKDFIFGDHYKHPQPDNRDVLTDEELKEYADALKAELALKKMSKKERRNMPPIYNEAKPLKIID